MTVFELLSGFLAGAAPGRRWGCVIATVLFLLVIVWIAIWASL